MEVGSSTTTTKAGIDLSSACYWMACEMKYNDVNDALSSTAEDSHAILLNVSGPDKPNFVFLSHGDKHKAFVRQLTSKLSALGINCYSDRSVEGQDFHSRIQVAQETIVQCTCFMVPVSRQTLNSELVRDQLAFAEDKGRIIFPVVLNDLDPGLDKRYSLARNNLFHFMANGMSFHSSFDSLVASLSPYFKRGHAHEFH
ncbi:hypothetical protein F441_03288 [Phytophthora nicotianae CJ01A1]|uniref:TIR domain-containing protein n=3 Tax=Phytophthora nicotianae TaxID=4792 RepID=W2XNU0_PHYNI|nr:hypothetical protein F441_03288 [Phytophthora nicotianae CJ01A1]